MERGVVRPSGASAKAVVCALIVIGVLLAVSRRAGAETLAPLVLAETAEVPGSVVFPARAPGARAITIVLHGMCSEPERACRHFAEAVSANEHLICPRATRRCDGGGSIWDGVGFERTIQAAVERAKRALPALADETEGRTLIGYSLGAFRALAIAEQGEGRYPRVMLIGAKVQPNLARLRKHGVKRLLLTAGRFDMMHDHMLRQTRRLEKAGFPARFLGLGPVGHFFTPSFGEYLPDALAWLHSEGTPELVERAPALSR